MAQKKLELLQNLNLEFRIDEKSSTHESLVIRTKFTTFEDVDEFAKELG